MITLELINGIRYMIHRNNKSYSVLLESEKIHDIPLEYIEIPNFYINNPFDDRDYYHRLIDCMNQIRNSEGDTIHINPNTDRMSILYFMDREFGEWIRKRTIEKYSKIPVDPQNRYFIYCFDRPFEGMYYGNDNKFHSIVYKSPEPLLFTTEDQALEFIRQRKQQYINLCEAYNNDEINYNEWDEKQMDWIQTCEETNNGLIISHAYVGQWIY